MTSLENAHAQHERHCHEFRNDTRREIVGIRSTLAKWSVYMGVITITANTVVVGGAVVLLLHFLGRMLKH